MKRFMEYRIISGRTVEIRRSWLPVRTGGEEVRGRAPRVAGNSSERKIRSNYSDCISRYAQGLNSNMDYGDIHGILHYKPEYLPKSFDEAEKFIGKLMAQLRRKFKKLYGRTPKVFFGVADYSPAKKHKTHYHHHIVIEAAAGELLKELWRYGSISFNYLDASGDYTDLAAYIIANISPEEAARPDRKKYHASRNLAKPIYTEPVPVSDVEGIEAPKDSIIKEAHSYRDESGTYSSSYMRCTLLAAPGVRGGKVVIPRKQIAKIKAARDRKQGRKNE